MHYAHIYFRTASFSRMSDTSIIWMIRSIQASVALSLLSWQGSRGQECQYRILFFIRDGLDIDKTCEPTVFVNLALTAVAVMANGILRVILCFHRVRILNSHTSEKEYWSTARYIASLVALSLGAWGGLALTVVLSQVEGWGFPAGGFRGGSLGARICRSVLAWTLGFVIPGGWIVGHKEKRLHVARALRQASHFGGITFYL